MSERDGEQLLYTTRLMSGCGDARRQEGQRESKNYTRSDGQAEQRRAQNHDWNLHLLAMLYTRCLVDHARHVGADAVVVEQSLRAADSCNGDLRG